VDHFDADAGVTLAGGGDVTGWTNQATGNDVTVGDPDTTVVAGPAEQDMIRFNNPSNGAGLRYTVSGGLASGYTVFAVVRLNDTIDGIANDYPRFLRTTGDTQALFIRQSDDQVEVLAHPIGTRPQADYAGPYGVGDVAILTARLTGTSQELYFNGALVGAAKTVVANYTIADGNTWEIGNSVKGDIGEILVYNSSASLADINETGMQLASDYGTTWGLPEFPVHLKLDGNLTNSGSDQSVVITQANGTEGTSSYVAGRIDQALNLTADIPGTSLDGDHVKITHTLAAQGTIAMWYYVDGSYNYQTVFDNSVNGDDWEMWVYGNNVLRFRVDAGSGDVQFDLDNLAGPDNWYHLAVTWDRLGDAQLFINGLLVATDAVTSWVVPGTDFYLGGGHAWNTDGTGIWDDVRLYNHVLGSAEVYDLFTPEPGTLTLLALGGMGMLARRRRRAR
ncbi:LamG domain-containing protein, partial [bacterium]|nr:LamG domain-containing protein [bacterium]